MLWYASVFLFSAATVKPVKGKRSLKQDRSHNDKEPADKACKDVA